MNDVAVSFFGAILKKTKKTKQKPKVCILFPIVVSSVELSEKLIEEY